jgi:hypothetical protein
MSLKIHTAANGHLSLEFGEYDSPLWHDVSVYLERDLGFTREGEVVAGFDEGIRQSFERGDILISAGWDNWSGDYLLANSRSGDEVLHALFARFAPNSSLHIDAAGADELDR